jgi:BirA family biotin operon repressor/biotin-[acetyl-CoA-carboxylase] ligase
LTETKVSQGNITQAVIGVGINWANPVPDTGISLELWQTAHNLSIFSGLEILTSTVLQGIESGIQVLEQEGIGILLPRYLDLLVNMGDQVHFNHFLGTIIGVTEQGDLRLKIAANNTEKMVDNEIAVQPGKISLGYR